MGYTEETVLRTEESWTVLLEVDDHLPPASHPGRGETWMVLEGRALAEVEGRSLMVGPGDVVRIRPGEEHSLENMGEGPLRLVELRRGEHLEEMTGNNNENDSYYDEMD